MLACPSKHAVLALPAGPTYAANVAMLKCRLPVQVIGGTIFPGVTTGTLFGTSYTLLVDGHVGTVSAATGQGLLTTSTSPNPYFQLQLDAAYTDIGAGAHVHVWTATAANLQSYDLGSMCWDRNWSGPKHSALVFDAMSPMQRSDSDIRQHV